MRSAYAIKVQTGEPYIIRESDPKTYALSRLLVVLVLVLCWAVPLWSQSSASVSGSVSDKSGARIVGASVEIKDLGTSATRSATTDDQGTFHFLSLNPSAYSIEVTHAGFRPAVVPNIQLLVNTPTSVNIVLEIATVATEATVEVAVPTVNTEDATVGNEFGEVQVRQLPLYARNVLDLLQLQPGVNDTGQVNGARDDQSNVTLDGVDVNDQETQAAFNSVLRVPVDSLQEFRVTTTNPNGDQGVASGAQVALITKSGTDSWHGSGYDFFRRTGTSANSYARKIAGLVSGPEELNWNIYGGSVGGPIQKQRLFFFVNYERFHQNSQSTESRNVPSDNLRNGILTYLNTNGTVSTVTADQIRTGVDPLGIGVNPNMLTLLQAYPHCNVCNQGADLGLNFAVFNFSSPLDQVENTGVIRLDYNLTRNGEHRLFWRGNYMGDNGQESLPQFPGQPVLNRQLNRSKGMLAAYTGALSQNLVIDLRYGYTRQSLAFGGGTNPDLGFDNSILDAPVSALRGLDRVVPVHNFVGTVNLIKGRHTLSFGSNVRLITNNRSDFAPSFPAAVISLGYASGTGSLDGAIEAAGGAPIDGSVLRATRTALLALFGGMTEFTNTYQFDKKGSSLPIGTPLARSFRSNSYDFFISDGWKVKPNLRLTFGVRYGYDSVPYETHGLETVTNLDLRQYLNQRISDQANGVPYSAAPLVGYLLGGKANNGPGLWNSNPHNFAPRFSFAWSPNSQNHLLKSTFGENGKTAIRGGFALTYDRLNNSVVINNSNDATFGLASPSINAAGEYNYATAPRFTGLDSIPNLAPPVSASPFPVTPPAALIGSLVPTGIIRSLKAPYSMSFDFSVQRELSRNFSLEAAYVGRLGRRLLVKRDVAAPYMYFRDPASGQTTIDAINQMRPYIDFSVPESQVLASLPKIPFFENLYGPTAPPGFDGTQSAYDGFYNWALGPNDYTSFASFPDGLASIGLPYYYSALGPNAFFNQQFQTYPTWTNDASSSYHALQVVLRKRLSSYSQFDINYTYSKSIDNGSFSGQATFFTGSVQNAFRPRDFFAVSDFYQPHQFNTNWLLQLPVGKGKKFKSDAGRVLDAFIGGWQMTGIYHLASGTPVNVTNSYFPTNYQFRGIADEIAPIATHVTGVNSSILPNLFSNASQALAAFAEGAPGTSGSRNRLRGSKTFNLDMGIGKTFHITEKQTLQFRWEAFNVTNTVFFSDPSLSLSRPAEFGQFRASSGPRQMQFGFRYDF